MEEFERLRESIKLLLVEGRDERLSDLVDETHAADVSRVIRELPRDDQVRLFRLLSPQHAGAVLAELDDPTLRELVGSLPEVEVSRVLDHADRDRRGARDQAIASSVIIATFTDVFGFFSFLGLATLLIRFLL